MSVSQAWKIEWQQWKPQVGKLQGEELARFEREALAQWLTDLKAQLDGDLAYEDTKAIGRSTVAKGRSDPLEEAQMQVALAASKIQEGQVPNPSYQPEIVGPDVDWPTDLQGLLARRRPKSAPVPDELQSLFSESEPEGERSKAEGG